MWNVLIVDDQNTSRHLIEMMVEGSSNYTVLKAIPLAKMADIYALTLPVDLIVMDIVMGEGPSGLEAAEKIKRLRAFFESKDYAAMLKMLDNGGEV